MKRAYIAAIAVIVTGVAFNGWIDRGMAAPAAPTTQAAAVSATPIALDTPGNQFQWSPSLRLAAVNAAPSHNDWKTLKVKSGDTLSELFKRAGLPATDWMTILHLKGKVDALRNLRPGDILRYQTTASGHLRALKFALGPLQTLHVSRSNGRYSYSVSNKPATVRVVSVAGTVHHSLLAAAENVGVDPTTAANLASLLSWRIDLSRSIRGGERFVLIYRQTYANHKLIKAGPILAAELVTGNRTITAFRYTDQNGHSTYYDKQGQSLKPSILRTPVNYTRVSSHFSRNRLNPVLHIWRPHYGVDLAAPMGTPIKAAANGHVKFIGRDGGYGRLIILKNFGPYSTRYGHMSHFAKGLEEGDFVKQGQVIGYVGESGVATGPHLHFEIRVNGEPEPPLKVALPDGTPIPGARKATFEKTIAPFLTALNSTPESGQTLLAQREVPEQDADSNLTLASVSAAMEARIEYRNARAKVGGQH